jgi:PPOX class probable F420-dependent enzyme
MTTIEDAAALCRADQGLAVISTLRADGTMQASIVNAAVMPHPLTGVQVVAFVTYGHVKIGNLRKRPQASATFKHGYRWATVEGMAELIGPDDPRPYVDDERLRLLREVFVAAGGVHDDWAVYDRVMAEERRAAVFIEPARIYGSG